METIIPPVNRELIQAELTQDKYVRNTRKGENEIYEVTAANSPNVMREIGRLRELSFRAAGGGTGKAVENEYCRFILPQTVKLSKHLLLGNGIQRGGGLIQDDDLGTVIQHLHDLQRLLFRNRHFINLFVWRNLKAVFRRYIKHLLACF